MKIAAIIPARYASTRLPGKPLLAETGRPLIRHVIEAVRTARRIDQVVVATDDERIAAAARDCGCRAELTREDHPSGTDRVAEVAHRMPEVDIFVNVQGDEPEIAGASIDQLVTLLRDDQDAKMATLCTPIRDELTYRQSSCVKVVMSRNRRALYFSRSPVPFHREGPPAAGVWGWLHLGIYAYRRDFLFEFAAQSPSPLELAERLEQLRVLETGSPIAIDVVEEPSVGIDTPEDYARFVARFRASQGT